MFRVNNYSHLIAEFHYIYNEITELILLSNSNNAKIRSYICTYKQQGRISQHTVVCYVSSK